MKKALYILILCGLFAVIPLQAVAQAGLHIAPYFDGRFDNNKRVVTLYATGKSLKEFHLTLYRSLTFEGQMAAVNQIEKAVAMDAKQAIEQETGHKEGQLVYAFYCLPPRSKKNDQVRYIFFRRTKTKSILVYMEGYATLDEIKKMFTK